DALLEKRVWMEPGANTTYVAYRVRRAAGPLTLTLRALVNYRDYHATPRGDGWRMEVTAVTGGLRVVAFEGAHAVSILAPGAEARAEHTSYRGFALAPEQERGLDAEDDHLHAGTLLATLDPGAALTVDMSTEAAPS